MDRETLTHWLESHPQLVTRDIQAFLDHCEREVKRHAVEDAWLAAKAYVERRELYWEHGWGFPRASEAYVAREVCAELARELGHHEPHPSEGDEEHLVGKKLFEALDPAARAKIGKWALELADREEHAVWSKIVRFTRQHARTMEKQGLLSHDMRPETGNFAEKAAGIAHVLVDELEARAHPRPRRATSH